MFRYMHLQKGGNCKNDFEWLIPEYRVNVEDEEFLPGSHCYLLLFSLYQFSVSNQNQINITSGPYHAA